MSANPPLKPLHQKLVASKLEALEKLGTAELIDSLKPDRLHSLKVRLDGTIMDGNHRIQVLRSRGVDVDGLPREMV